MEEGEEGGGQQGRAALHSQYSYGPGLDHSPVDNGVFLQSILVLFQKVTRRIKNTVQEQKLVKIIFIR